MDIKPVTQQLSVATQVTPADLPRIKAQGYMSLICNRPDGESADQPAFADIQHAANSLGITCLYQPIVSGSITQEDASRFSDAVQTIPGPTLAFCRTGTRSVTLWAMVAASALGIEEVQRRCQQAGYDLSNVLRRS